MMLTFLNAETCTSHGGGVLSLSSLLVPDAVHPRSTRRQGSKPFPLSISHLLEKEAIDVFELIYTRQLESQSQVRARVSLYM